MNKPNNQDSRKPSSYEIEKQLLKTFQSSASERFQTPMLEISLKDAIRLVKFSYRQGDDSVIGAFKSVQELFSRGDFSIPGPIEIKLKNSPISDPIFLDLLAKTKDTFSLSTVLEKTIQESRESLFAAPNPTRSIE